MGKVIKNDWNKQKTLQLHTYFPPQTLQLKYQVHQGKQHEVSLEVTFGFRRRPELSCTYRCRLVHIAMRDESHRMLIHLANSIAGGYSLKLKQE